MLALAMLALAAAAASASAPPCKSFDALYGGGRELCNRLFGDAFVYSDGSSDEAYTMWFFESANPNDAVSRRRNASVPDTCQLQYFHKTAPGPEVGGEGLVGGGGVALACVCFCVCVDGGLGGRRWKRQESEVTAALLVDLLNPWPCPPRLDRR